MSWMLDSSFFVKLVCENASHVRIETNNEAVIDHLNSKFTFEVPGHQFMASYKRGKWDGRIRLYDKNSGCMPRGLLPDLVNEFRDGGFGKLSLEGYDKKLHQNEDFEAWIEENKHRWEFEPDDYQIEAAIRIINEYRRLIVSPTSSGKTFIMYMVIQYLIDRGMIDRQFLVIVTSVLLLDQFYDDMLSFGMDPSTIHKIRGDKSTKAKVVVSTWQSIYELAESDENWFKKFEAVLADECHLATGQSIQKIMNACVNADYRAGFTGSLKDSKVDQLVLRGLFGRVYETITTKELAKRGRIAEATVRMLSLNYSRFAKKYPKYFDMNYDYQGEIELLTAIKPRDERIFKLCDEHYDENILVLFSRVRHGERMYEEYRKRHPDREVFLICGKVSQHDRQRFKKAMVAGSNVVIFATYATLSTGVSINEINVGILASPVKSKTTVLQAIGRYLRKSKTKTAAIIYDIVDEFKFKDVKRPCYSVLHAESRLNRYIESGFKIEERIDYV